MQNIDKTEMVIASLLESQSKMDEAIASSSNKRSHKKVGKDRTEENSMRGQYFACVFQIDFPDQMELFHYIRQYEGGVFPQIAYILHDKDVYESDGTHSEWDGEKAVEVSHKQGDPKKPHIHFVWKMKNRTTANAMSKFLGGYWVLKVESIEAKLAYLLHQTWESRHKHQYDFKELQGTPKLKDLVTAQKSNFVQLRAFVDLTNKGYTTTEILYEIEATTSLSREEKNEYIAFIMSHLGGLVTMQNQHWNKFQTLEKWFTAGHKEGYDAGLEFYAKLKEVGANNV